MNVNSQHDINGWTALHWAAKRNHLNIVNKLLNHGADKSIKTNKGEIPASLTSENVIKVLLSANVNTSPAPAKEEKLAITPNYIKNPPVAYQVEHCRIGSNGMIETISGGPRREREPCSC